MNVLQASPYNLTQANRDAGVALLRSMRQMLESEDRKQLAQAGLTLVSLVSSQLAPAGSLLSSIMVFATGGRNNDPVEFERVRMCNLDLACWQFLKFCRAHMPYPVWTEKDMPSAVEICYQATKAKGNVDNVVMCYRAIIMYHQGGHDEEAAADFKTAFGKGKTEVGPENTLMFQSYYARVLRRLNRIEEAKKQEAAVAGWVKMHPYALPLEELQAAVLLPDENKEDNEVYKLIPGQFDNVYSLGNGIEVHSANGPPRVYPMH